LLDHEIEDGGDAPSWKLWNRHILTKNYPIFMKFGIQQHIWNSMTVSWPMFF